MNGNERILTTILIIILIAPAIFLAGCTSGKTDASGDNTSAPTARPLQVLTVGDGGTGITTVDPGNGGGIMAEEKALMVETLVDSNPDFTLTPGLAKSWRLVDNNTWEFVLRDDVYFHNGQKMTASDVNFSITRAVNYTASLKTQLDLKSIQVIGDYTIRFITNKLNPIMPAYLSQYTTSIISPASLDASGNFVQPVGTGPFMFGSLDEQTGTLTVVRNPHWWGGNVSLDKMIFKSLPDPNTRSLSLQNGEVDLTCDIPLNEMARVGNISGLDTQLSLTSRVYRLDMNLKKDAFADVRVRQAISLAIDREDICENVLYGAGEPAAGPYLPTMAWANKSLVAIARNLDKAKQLLQAAGWTDTDHDGIVDKNGKPLSFTMMTWSTRPALPTMATAIASELKEIGIDVKTQVMDYGAISDAQKQGSWDTVLGTWSTGSIPDPDAISGWYKTGGSQNYGYSNPQVDRLISDARNTTDNAVRYKDFSQMEGIVYSDQPSIIVAYYGFCIAKKDSVKGYVYDPTAHDYNINPGVCIG